MCRTLTFPVLPPIHSVSELGSLLVLLPTAEPQTRTWVLVVSLGRDLQSRSGAGRRCQEKREVMYGMHYPDHSRGTRALLPLGPCTVLPARSSPCPLLPQLLAPFPISVLTTQQNLQSCRNRQSPRARLFLLCLHPACIKTYCFPMTS